MSTWTRDKSAFFEDYSDERQDLSAEGEPARRSQERLVGPLEEDSLKMFWRRIHQYPLLTAEREVELAKRIEQGDKVAHDEMVNCNLRLVGSIARKCRRHAGNAMSLADLIQEGNCGLLKAVQKFDYRRGWKFSTYASYWIRQSIMRAIDEQSRSIRLPVHVAETVTRADRAYAILTQQLHRPPTGKEMAAHLRIPENKMQELSGKGSEPMSLDMTMGDEEDSVLMDFLEDQNAASPVDCASRLALREELLRAFECLSAREVEVLSLRYGIHDSSCGRTLDDVGSIMGLTRERIRQIETGALKRLRRQAALRETAYGLSRIAMQPSYQEEDRVVQSWRNENRTSIGIQERTDDKAVAGVQENVSDLSVQSTQHLALMNHLVMKIAEKNELPIVPNKAMMEPRSSRRRQSLSHR